MDRDCVIVGVDGSPVSAIALTWAVDAARLRGSELMVVTVFDQDTPHEAGRGAGANTTTAEERCRDIQARMVRTLPTDSAPGNWTSRVLQGDPAAILTRLAGRRLRHRCSRQGFEYWGATAVRRHPPATTPTRLECRPDGTPVRYDLPRPCWLSVATVAGVSDRGSWRADGRGIGWFKGSGGARHQRSAAMRCRWHRVFGAG